MKPQGGQVAIGPRVVDLADPLQGQIPTPAKGFQSEGGLPFPSAAPRDQPEGIAARQMGLVEEELELKGGRGQPEPAFGDTERLRGGQPFEDQAGLSPPAGDGHGPEGFPRQPVDRWPWTLPLGLPGGRTLPAGGGTGKGQPGQEPSGQKQRRDGLSNEARDRPAARWGRRSVSHKRSPPESRARARGRRLGSPAACAGGSDLS